MGYIQMQNYHLLFTMHRHFEIQLLEEIFIKLGFQRQIQSNLFISQDKRPHVKYVFLFTMKYASVTAFSVPCTKSVKEEINNEKMSTVIIRNIKHILYCEVSKDKYLKKCNKWALTWLANYMWTLSTSYNTYFANYYMLKTSSPVSMHWYCSMVCIRKYFVFLDQ